MIRIVTVLFIVNLLLACSSSKQVVHDPEKANEVLISFITKAQAGFWEDAMGHITYSERMQMMEGELVKKEYQVAINRLRLSVVAKMPFSLDEKGRLVGIKDMLDASNKRYVISDEQRNVNLGDVERARSERINRLREEGQKVLEEQNRQRGDGQDVIYTNRLSEDEREQALQGNLVPAKADVVSADEWQENTSAAEGVSEEQNAVYPESPADTETGADFSEGDEWH